MSRIVSSNAHARPVPGPASPLKVLSLHWGFSIGGVGKYGALLDGVGTFAPIQMMHLCLLGRGWQCDRRTLSTMGVVTIELRSRFDVSWIWKVVREIKRLEPDVIMSHGFNGHFVAMVCGSLVGRRIPLLCSYHGRYHATSALRRIVAPFYNRFTEYYIRRRAMAVVAVAEHTRRYLVSHGVAPDKIEVIHNGLASTVRDGGGRERLRAEWNVGEEELLLGVASRLDPVKGVEFLLGAFSALAERHANLKLIIVGTGASEAALKSRVCDLNLRGRVVFTGFRSDVDDCLAAFDIFVLPSLAEYHSIALLEAMRAGKPIVATDVGGNTESVRHRREALVVPAGDANSLAVALGELVGDGALRAALGSAARARFLSEFTVERMIRNTAGWMVRSARRVSARQPAEFK